eukprot:GFUD01035269.1.p1 GENE.GFUD01035269.1~~GFUD01035269.1.p1  ORF type:complete len:353 (+),score=108.56 GFUD01035269.1:36-1094(+)
MPDLLNMENSSFNSSLTSSLSSLLATSSLCDCSLICSDGQLSAHKVILAATSSFFSSVFSLHHHNHPLIYLRGIKTDQMQAVLNFLYSGVANVAEEGVEDFLAVAHDLKIEGLMVKHKKLATAKKRKRKKSINNEVMSEQENHATDSDTETIQTINYKPANKSKRKSSEKASHIKKPKTSAKKPKPSAIGYFDPHQPFIPDTSTSFPNPEKVEEAGTSEEIVAQSMKDTIEQDDSSDTETIQTVHYKKRKNSEDSENSTSFPNAEKKKKKLHPATVSQNSLPRLNIPQSHSITSLTTMLPHTLNCPVCNTRVVSSLKSHMEHTHKTKCQNCKQIFYNCNSLHQHKKGNCQAK